MTTPQRRRREAGLTLVEMLIAVALLGIVLLGIAPLFIASVKSNYSANEYTSIHNLARDRLEALMNIPIPEPTTPGYVIQLAPGPYLTNDLPPFLPDPLDPTGVTTIRNPLTRSYSVTHYKSFAPAAPGDPFSLQPVATPGTDVYDFKRIDVTVTSVSATGGPLTGLGFGQRTARVTGFLRNPDPLNNAK